MLACPYPCRSPPTAPRHLAAARCARRAGAEKEAALREFAAGRRPVLVSTTVVEVGVDVPAASLILVEHADRSAGPVCIPPSSCIEREALQAL